MTPLGKGVQAALVALVDDWAARVGAKSALDASPDDGVLSPGAVLAAAARRGLRTSTDDGTAEPYDLVVLRGGADSSSRIELFSPRATLAMVVLAPREDRAAGHALAASMWRVGRVRERAFLDEAPLAALLPRALRSRAARIHAYLVDTRPRTPQGRARARRTLGIAP